MKMKPLYKQLLLNILEAYSDRLGNDGCNDLDPNDKNDILLREIDFKTLEKHYKDVMSDEIEQDACPPTLSQNWLLCHMMEKVLKDIPIN